MRHQSGVVLGEMQVNATQHPNPGLDVPALSPPDLPLGGRRQAGEVPILDPNQVGFAQREVQVEVDQTVQCGGWIGGFLNDSLRTGQQSRAYAHEQLDEQCFLVREVAVDGGTADSGGGTDVLKSHGRETALGNQLLGGGQQL